MNQIYHTWIFPLYHSHYTSPPHPISGIVWTDIIFVFTCMSTHFLHCIYHLLSLAPLTGTKLPPWAGLVSPSSSPILQKKKEKRYKRKTWHFTLFEVKVATQGVSIYIWKLAYLLWFSSFYLCPILMVASASLRFLYSFFV
jgi:hypothetical protein